MNRYKSNYSLIDALQEGQSMVNALEPSDLSALHTESQNLTSIFRVGGREWRSQRNSCWVKHGHCSLSQSSPLQKRPPVLADLQCFLKPELQGRGDTHVRGIKSGRTKPSGQYGRQEVTYPNTS